MPFDEERLRAIETRQERTEQRITTIEKDFAVGGVHAANVETRLLSIETTLSRLVWLIITALVVSVMTFIIKGGLHV